jgi:hypothetical protein
MGSDLSETTAPEVAGETTSPWEHIAEASFSTATVLLSSGKAIDGQTA